MDTAFLINVKGEKAKRLVTDIKSIKNIEKGITLFIEKVNGRYTVTPLPNQ